MTPDDLKLVAEGRRRAASIRRAASVASVSGWTMGLFAALSLVGGCFGDIPSLIAGLALAGVAWNELAGAAMLRRFDLAAPKRLALNQLAASLLIVAYASWSIYANLHDPALQELTSGGDFSSSPEIGEMVGRISTMVTWGFYGGVALAGIIAPGLTALYYASRATHLRRLRDETPAWVIETLRAAAE